MHIVCSLPDVLDDLEDSIVLDFNGSAFPGAELHGPEVDRIQRSNLVLRVHIVHSDQDVILTDLLRFGVFLNEQRY